METKDVVTIIIIVVMLAVIGVVIALSIKIDKEKYNELSEEQKEQTRRENKRFKKELVKAPIYMAGIFGYIVAISFMKVLLYDPSIPNRWWILVGIGLACGALTLFLGWLISLIDKMYEKKELTSLKKE